MLKKYTAFLLILTTFCSLYPERANSKQKMDDDFLSRVKVAPDTLFFNAFIELEDQIDILSLKEYYASMGFSGDIIVESTVRALQEKSNISQRTIINELFSKYDSTEIAFIKSIWLRNGILLKAVPEVILNLSKDERVKFIHENSLLLFVSVHSAPVDTSTFYILKEHLKNVDPQRLRRAGYSGKNQKIFIIGAQNNYPRIREFLKVHQDSVERAALTKGIIFEKAEKYKRRIIRAGNRGLFAPIIYPIGSVENGDTLGIAYNSRISGIISLDTSGSLLMDVLLAMQQILDRSQNTEVPSIIILEWLPEAKSEFRIIWETIRLLEYLNINIVLPYPYEYDESYVSTIGQDGLPGIFITGLSEIIGSNIVVKGSLPDRILILPDIITDPEGDIFYGVPIALGYAAGLIAVIQEISPQIWRREIQRVLEFSAEVNPASFPRELGTFRCVNAFLSFMGVKEGISKFSGTALDKSSETAIENAQIALSGKISVTLLSDRDGNFKSRLIAGKYITTVSRYGYEPDTIEVNLAPQASLYERILLNPRQKLKASGKLSTHLSGFFDLTSELVFRFNDESYFTYSDSEGNFSIQLVPAEYSVQVIPPFPFSVIKINRLKFGSEPLYFLLEPGDVVLVEDVGDREYLHYYSSALDSLGIDYSVMNTEEKSFSPSGMKLINRKTAIWFSGDLKEEILTRREIDSIAVFLDTGGYIIFTGQNIAESVQDTAFLSRYLGLKYMGNRNELLLFGVKNGGIGERISYISISGPDGADNQTSPDLLTPVSGGIPIFSYDEKGLSAGGISFINNLNQSRVVFLGFGIESVSQPEKSKIFINREDLIKAILYWLWEIEEMEVESEGKEIRVDLIKEEKFYLYQNFPNPFNMRTGIKFTLLNKSDVKLTVYNILGKEVAVLVNSRMEAGEYMVNFNPIFN
ncbi:MAG: hypothetical protein ACE5QV_03740, partial [Fidelibacterota bacterium]